MGETKERKVVRRSVAFALGIVCIILILGLVGASAYYESMINTKSSQGSQTALQSWTEGNYSFSISSGNNTSYAIPTGGFKSLSITIDANNFPTNQAPYVFQAFVGSIVANKIVGYQVYDVLSKPVFMHSTPLPGSPPWASYWRNGFNFGQTFEVNSSEVMVWIWNNSTVPIWGNLFYYVTA